MDFSKRLKELRKEYNLTQSELANKLFVSREAVSRWERNKSIPAQDTLSKICEIFKISMDDLLGINTQLAIDLSNKNRMLKKITVIFLFIISVLLILFFSYYFINTYNTTKVYMINYEDKDLLITDGILVITNEKLYFRLGDIKSDKEIKGLKLYYYDNNKEKLICKIDGTKMILYDFKGYNNYFNYDKLNIILKYLKLDIIYEESILTIDLDIKRDYINDKLIFNNKKENVSDINKNKVNYSQDLKNLISKMQKKFKYDKASDDYVYEKKEKNTKMKIVLYDDMLIMFLNNDDYSKQWFLYFIDDSIDFVEERKNDNNFYKLVNSFSYSNKTFYCNIKKCQNEQKEIDYFYDMLNKILS